ncbi:MAG: sigma-54 dependent transcriptional regulator [Ignavibacteria bacterium]|jgi:DNA-binding NtrC family response regulator|nr:sigma-54 dependent transcriptional regulator [Ignavibacteria bacterium]
MEKENYSIVVIDDDPLVNQTIKSIFIPKYERVEAFLDAAEALDKLHTINPDLLFLDIYIGYHNGIEILEQLRKEGWTMPVIIITAHHDINLAVKAMKLGAEDFALKPLNLEQLEISAKRSLHNKATMKRLEIAQEKLQIDQPNEIIGSSEGMRKALNTARIVASAENTTVLITGESGTGKELLAHFIHDNSPRAKGPFISINCGAIPRDLAENELFGHEKGAFTGATDKVKLGKFEQAQHGTILLDEVAELSQELQIKLLRVLQERKFFRLGGSKEVSIDVRVIAATNKNLENAIEDGTFREDLYYRLNVANILLPPLRDRGDDILTLAFSFVKEFNHKFGRAIKGVSPEAADILMHHSWKGNIRELRNIIERVVLLHESDDPITKEELSFVKSSSMLQVAGKATNIEIPDRGHFLQISHNGAKMEDVVKDLIIQTLKLTGGNQVAATKLLDTSRARLRYRIEQYGIVTDKTIE